MEKLRHLLQWWLEYQIPPFIERNLAPNLLTTRLVPVLVGPRRSGKSTIFFQLITQLRQQYPAENILYINYEDDRLQPFEGYELSSLLDVYRQSFRANAAQPIFLFLDEIQNVPNWERTVRRLSETESGVRIFITGSNSRMLSSDIATALRGRTLSFRIFPLDFREFLKFKNFAIPEIEALRYSSIKHNLLFLFEEYLHFGGFPEVVLSQSAQEKEAILKEYMHTLFFADIVQRYGIRQVKILDTFIKILSRQMAGIFSIGKMVSNLKSIGLKASKSTLIEYLGYIEDAFLGKSISIYSYSIKDQLQYPKKFYLLDNGLYRATAFINSGDWGRLLENLVFVHLYHQFDDIFYWKSTNGYEVDFVIPSLFPDKKNFSLIQVCYDISNERARQREIRSLVKAAREFDVQSCLIITRDVWDQMQVDEINIQFLPFIYWALKGPLHRS